MAGLGRSLVKSHKRKQRFVAKDGHRHSTDLPDGRDWGRLNLHSITEQTSLNDFLDKVQLADKEYNSEFFNIKIVSQDTASGILSESEKLSVSTAQEKHKNLLRIPRRPQWDQNTSKEELDRNENESFLEWRRNLSSLNEEEHINLTPYEKNLEVWRQLWRVIERSDVVVQILDSRNPLQFRCEDLEIYVKETDEKKLNVLLLNKADFLTLRQREMWAHYFSSIGVKVAFFSALQQMQKDEEASEESESDELSDSELKKVTEAQDFVTKESLVEMKKLSCNVDEQSANQRSSDVYNDPKLLSREELAMFLKNLCQEVQSNSVARVGLVGYPNVGKSSTINAVLSSKKVSVSATPGRTKHFQTIMVDPELCFCDCPGLVFPNFVSTKAEMVINGILPIDQLTSHIPPVTLVVSVIPREVLESTYSIKLPTPSEGEDPSRPPTAEEFLGAHGYMRGFMTHRGLPDTARSARYILKDFVNGKLLYCHAPPDVKQEEYQEFSLKNLAKTNTSVQSAFHGAESINAGENFDQKFFKMLRERKKSKEAESLSGFPGAHVKNPDHAKRMVNGQKVSNNAKNAKKEYKWHHNKNRKEKLRRVHAHLDQ